MKHDSLRFCPTQTWVQLTVIFRPMRVDFQVVALDGRLGTAVIWAAIETTGGEAWQRLAFVRVHLTLGCSATHCGLARESASAVTCTTITRHSWKCLFKIIMWLELGLELGSELGLGQWPSLHSHTLSVIFRIFQDISRYFKFSHLERDFQDSTEAPLEIWTSQPATVKSRVRIHISWRIPIILCLRLGVIRLVLDVLDEKEVDTSPSVPCPSA